jgi:hypothetical protein
MVVQAPWLLWCRFGLLVHAFTLHRGEVRLGWRLKGLARVSPHKKQNKICYTLCDLICLFYLIRREQGELKMNYG